MDEVSCLAKQTLPFFMLPESERRSVLQCDGLKMELQELQVMYDSSQKERAELEEELQRCKAELDKLSGGAQVSECHQHANTPGGGVWAFLSAT